MKKLLFVALFAILLAGNSNAQAVGKNYVLQSGNIVEAVKATKKPDKVYQVVNGVTFYQGLKGGVYYWTTNKAGKKVKRYVKKQN